MTSPLFPPRIYRPEDLAAQALLQEVRKGLAPEVQQLQGMAVIGSAIILKMSFNEALIR